MDSLLYCLCIDWFLEDVFFVKLLRSYLDLVFRTDICPFQLYHAMMALSALSLADREGVQNLDALNHYQRTLPSLQQMMHSEEDLFSTGLMLTHFILLLYEVCLSNYDSSTFSSIAVQIAAAQPWGTTLWSEHLEHRESIEHT